MVNNRAEHDSIHRYKKYLMYQRWGKKGKERTTLWQSTIFQLKPSLIFQDNVAMVPFTQPTNSQQHNVEVELMPRAKDSHNVKGFFVAS